MARVRDVLRGLGRALDPFRALDVVIDGFLHSLEPRKRRIRRRKWSTIRRVDGSHEARKRDLRLNGNGEGFLTELRAEAEKRRQKHRDAPLGMWHTTEDTFMVVMDEIWSFQPDGSGSITYTGFNHYVKDRETFTWETVGERNIRIHRDTSEEEQLEEPQEDEPYWEEIRYDFQVLAHPVDPDPFLHTIALVDQHGGFSLLGQPLYYYGPSETQASAQD